MNRLTHRRKRLFSLLLCCGTATVWGEQPTLAAPPIPLHGASSIRFATVQEGVSAVTKRDAFIATMSPFDRQVRLMTERDVTEKEYLQFISRHVLPWNEKDQSKLVQAIEAVRGRLAPFDLKFPPTVLLVSTTGREESEAAYCRGNAVVLPKKIAGRKPKGLEDLLAHELFHILSSHNPELRRVLYRIVGFQPCSEVQLPGDLSVKKITNPDAPQINYYTEVEYLGETVKVVPILYSSAQRYDREKGGNLFRYLQFRLMAVEQMGGFWQPTIRDERPQLLTTQQVPSYFDRIGRNTGYIIHPEEVLADNFVKLINGDEDLPTPRIVEAMRRHLIKK